MSPPRTLKAATQSQDEEASELPAAGTDRRDAQEIQHPPADPAPPALFRRRTPPTGSDRWQYASQDEPADSPRPSFSTGW